jgi:hypothetical protein
VYAGRECARALAKDSLSESDCTADLGDCTAKELQRLEERLAHIQATYDEVGKVRGSLDVAHSSSKLCVLARGHQHYCTCTPTA